MAFKHMVDEARNIVVSKSVGDVTVMDIITELQQAINTKRGEGVARRLIDMTESQFRYNIEDAHKVVKMVKLHARVLGSRKMAVLLREIPDIEELTLNLIVGLGAELMPEEFWVRFPDSGGDE